MDAPRPEPAPIVVRALASEDFAHLRRLEDEIWGDDPVGRLCPHYLRLCTEVYPAWCFLALQGDRPVGYVLNFPSGTEAFCATLAVHPSARKGRTGYLLIRAMVAKVLQEGMERCRFLVEPGNREAREVHASLGARVVGELRDFYGPGDHRLLSVITREDLDRLRSRYARLRLVS